MSPQNNILSLSLTSTSLALVLAILQNGYSDNPFHSQSSRFNAENAVVPVEQSLASLGLKLHPSSKRLLVQAKVAVDL